MGYPLDLDEHAEHRLLGELIRRAKLRKQGLCDYCGRSAVTKACKFPGRHTDKDRTRITLRQLSFAVDNEYAPDVMRGLMGLDR
jgi:hypothetical protein